MRKNFVFHRQNPTLSSNMYNRVGLFQPSWFFLELFVFTYFLFFRKNPLSFYTERGFIVENYRNLILHITECLFEMIKEVVHKIIKIFIIFSLKTECFSVKVRLNLPIKETLFILVCCEFYSSLCVFFYKLCQIMRQLWTHILFCESFSYLFNMFRIIRMHDKVCIHVFVFFSDKCDSQSFAHFSQGLLARSYVYQNLRQVYWIFLSVQGFFLKNRALKKRKKNYYLRKFGKTF